MLSSNGETSHSFAWWDGGNMCNAMRDYYEAYTTGYAAYYEGYAALQEKFGDDYNYEDPAWRLGYCEVYRAYYGGFADAYAVFSNNRTLGTLNLNHPDATQSGQPIAGTYTRSDGYYYGDDDDSVGGDGPSFNANRTHFSGNYYQAYVDLFDCENFANDPAAELVPYDVEYDDMMESWSVSEGTLTLAEASSSSWSISVTDGVQQDENGDSSAFILDQTFSRCEVEYELPGYDYD